MKKYILSFIILCSVPFTFTFAATPQFTASGSGDGNNVLITTTSADGNSPVALYFKSNTDGTTRSQVVGITDSVGGFSGTISTTGLGINATTPVYVIINGYTSNSLTWPYQYGQFHGDIMFSKTNPFISFGQSSSLIISGGIGNYFISSNSNSSIISAAITGNTLSYSGLLNGSSVITICGTGGGLCNSITISTNNTSGGGLTISPTYLSLNQNQAGVLVVNGGNAPYTFTVASGDSLSYTITGNSISISSSVNGSRLVNICSTNNICSQVTVNVIGTTGGLTTNPSSLTLSPGQSGTFTISGGNAPYTVTTVSGENLMYFANGNSISISGTINGTRLLDVCSSNNVCSQMTVTITGVMNNAVTLNPSMITLTPNQNGTVQLSGGNGSYTVSTISGDSVSALISGNMLTVSSQTSGNRTLSICSSNATCSTLQVSIGGVGQTSNLQYSLFLAVNDTMRLNLTGGNGSPFYIQSGMSSSVMASINNTVLSVTGKNFGSSSVTVCQTGNIANNCLPFTFVVNQADTSNNGTGGPYTFNIDLWYGQTSSEVTELQKYLIGENYLVSDATGYFGSLTLDAVKRFQASKSISTTGYVGTLTRGALNNN